MTCEVVRTYLSDFIDEALPAGILADIREHIADCLSCEELRDALLAAENFYGAGAGREAPGQRRRSLNRRLEDLVNAERKT